MGGEHWNEKEKKENLSCRKHFKGADFSFRSGMMRVQIPRGTPLGPPNWEEEEEEEEEVVVEERTQFFLTYMHPHKPHTHTDTHTPGLFYRSPPVQCSCRGASVYPKPHSQTSTSSSTFSSPVSPCSSRSRSHSLHRGRRDYRWVKFTSLRKLFDITNKVKVYQKTPEDYIIMVCWVARCTSRSKK